MFAVAPESARWRAAFLFAACLGFAGAIPARAQDATPPPAEPPADSSAAAQEAAPAAPVPPPAAPAAAPGADTTLALPVLFEPRSSAAIDSEIQLMTRLKRESEQRSADFKLRQANRAAQAEAKKAEVANTKQQVDLAKKEKRAADQKEFEKRRKQLATQQKFLERLRDLYGARVETEQATAAYAQARLDECKTEIKLNNLGILTSTAIRTGAATRMALNELNGALKLRAERMATAASREQTQANKRQAVLDAYDDMFR